MNRRSRPDSPGREQRVRAPRPCWWLPGAHLPTIWANGVRLASGALERIELVGSDGDLFHVDLRIDADESSGPAVVLVPGLTGSSDSAYVQSIASRLVGLGARPYILNWRGYGGGPNRLPRTFHAADHVGLDALVEHLRADAPARRIHAVGFSLGGNMLAHALGSGGPSATIDRAWIIGAPYDLGVTAEYLDASSRFYRRRLVRDLVDTVRRRSRDVDLGLDASVYDEIQTFREYDDRITAPLNGFGDASRYWSDASARARIAHVRTPTTWIHASDDPIIPNSGAPRPDELPDSVEFVRVDRGGHLAFMTGRVPFRPRYWLEEQIANAAADREVENDGAEITPRAFERGTPT